MRALLAGIALLAVGCTPSQPTAPEPIAPVSAARPGVVKGSAQSGVAAPATPGQLLPAARRVPAPDVEFVEGSGIAITLKQFEGRVVLLNLWATWCAPCVREMPSLDRLAGNQPALAVVPVSMDVQAPSAVRFLQQNGLANLAVYHDPDGQLMRRFGAHGLPASIVIDREGRIAVVLTGAVDWSSAAIRELLAGI